MHHRFHAFSAEDLFLVGLGFDMAGAYLVSRGLVRPVPKLAASGGTIWALERPRVPDAVEDHFRGIVGLVVLVLGFAVQATGYAITVSKGRLHFQSGAKQALIGLGLALVAAASVPLLERLVRPRYRDRKLIKVARFDPSINGLRPQPLAHLLRSYGEELHTPKLGNEDDVAYCRRVFKVQAVEDWPPTDQDGGRHEGMTS
jgi:hypothetical protein